MRILVVDDSLQFQRLVHRILEQKQEFQIVGDVSDGLAAVQKANELKPDLVLLDIGLPKLNGIEAAKRIAPIIPSAKILFVTMNSDAAVVEAALNSGGQGYVLKADAGSELWPAIEAVFQGMQYVSSGLNGSWRVTLAGISTWAAARRS